MSLSDINTRIIETTYGTIAPAQSQMATDEQSLLLDRDWLTSAFMIPDDAFSRESDKTNRYWSSANAKYTDTRLGCNIGINPRPQWCMYSDIPVKGRLNDRADVSLTSVMGNYGMGRQYSEMIDDGAQRVYMTFGIPQFNSMIEFLRNAYISEQMSLVRSGRGNSVFYQASWWIGRATAMVAFPTAAIAILSIQTFRAFFTRSPSSFYSMKPTMHLYWGAVTQLVNNMLVNRGIFPKIMAEEKEQRIGRPYTLDPAFLEGLSTLMPDVFSKGFYMDVYAMANRAQRLANKLFMQEYNALSQGTATDYSGYVAKELNGNGGHPTSISDDKGNATLGAIMNRAAMISYWFNDQTEDQTTVNDERDPRVGQDGKMPSGFEGAGFTDYLDALFRDGAMFATFIVDHTGSTQESFSSSVVESELSQTLNQTSSNFNSMRFSLADGNILGDVGKAATDAIGGVVTGALDGMTFGVSQLLRGLAGTGYIDIPKHWQSSSVQLPRASYTMQLISPYGNAISQMISLDIPMAMLLAGALPRSTGKASYGPPFMCQIYDRGRCQIRLGMITDLTFSRGTSHLSFGQLGNAMAIDVSFSVVDMSSIMHMPISSGPLDDITSVFDEDNILTDYLAVLGGQSIYSQIYPMSKAKLAFAKTVMQAGKFTSPAYYASAFHDSATSGMLQYLTLGATKVIEGLSRGTNNTDPLHID